MRAGCNGSRYAVRCFPLVCVILQRKLQHYKANVVPKESVLYDICNIGLPPFVRKKCGPDPNSPAITAQTGVVSQFELSFFLYGPRFLGAGALASIKPTIQAVSCSVSETPAAIAGVIFSVL